MTHDELTAAVERIREHQLACSRLAIDEGLDCIEFEANCKQAINLADQADHMSGFKARDGAKGVVAGAAIHQAKLETGVFAKRHGILMNLDRQLACWSYNQ